VDVRSEMTNQDLKHEMTLHLNRCWPGSLAVAVTILGREFPNASPDDIRAVANEHRDKNGLGYV
jgi:hypothetical protein